MTGHEPTLDANLIFDLDIDSSPDLNPNNFNYPDYLNSVVLIFQNRFEISK